MLPPSVQLHALTLCLSFSENKMTLAELKSLVETMNNLPCVMNKLEEMQVRRTQCHNHKETI